MEIDHQCHTENEHRILQKSLDKNQKRNLGLESISKKLLYGDASKIENRVDFVILGDGFAAHDQ